MTLRIRFRAWLHSTYLWNWWHSVLNPIPECIPFSFIAGFILTLIWSYS